MQAAAPIHDLQDLNHLGTLSVDHFYQENVQAGQYYNDKCKTMVLGFIKVHTAKELYFYFLCSVRGHISQEANE